MVRMINMHTVLCPPPCVVRFLARPRAMHAPLSISLLHAARFALRYTFSLLTYPSRGESVFERGEGVHTTRRRCVRLLGCFLSSIEVPPVGGADFGVFRVLVKVCWLFLSLYCFFTLVFVLSFGAPSPPCACYCALSCLHPSRNVAQHLFLVCVVCASHPFLA